MGKLLPALMFNDLCGIGPSYLVWIWNWIVVERFLHVFTCWVGKCFWVQVSWCNFFQMIMGPAHPSLPLRHLSAWTKKTRSHWHICSQCMERSRVAPSKRKEPYSPGAETKLRFWTTSSPPCLPLNNPTAIPPYLGQATRHSKTLSSMWMVSGSCCQLCSPTKPQDQSRYHAGYSRN